MRVRVGVVIPARNEERYIGKTLSALLNQELRPSEIVVVDDGSKDDTPILAESYGVKVIRLKDRGYRATGLPILASVINKGLEALEEAGPFDYLMVLGADHLLPRNYLSELTKRMERNVSLAIASGIILGESGLIEVPRGSGRVVRYSFWNSIGLRYPLNYGWEAYIIFKALAKGYEVKVFKDLITLTLRPTGRSTNSISYGRAMKALGYPVPYVLARMVVNLNRGLRWSVGMVAGFLSSPKGFKYYEDEVRSYVKLYACTRLMSGVLRLLKGCIGLG
ncbi:MAG: hypothetical protein B6U69_01645 [Thermofilum sp. ex4484_15]|nr:MAG: hypothetical protein B6U69_01645 [Thermofilum sp. ex4484_15]